MSGFDEWYASQNFIYSRTTEEIARYAWIASRNAAESGCEVTISEADSLGEDEAYCHWFSCPMCGSDSIMQASRYCLDCGVRIRWVQFKSNEVFWERVDYEYDRSKDK